MTTRDWPSIRNEFRARIAAAKVAYGDMAEVKLLVTPDMEQRIVDAFPRAANLKNRPEDGRTKFEGVRVCSSPLVPPSKAALVELVREDPDHLDKLALEAEDMGEHYDEDLADWVDGKLEAM